MSNDDFDQDFMEDPHPPTPGGFVLDLEGYEGPIDALLQLARDQKVDLRNISILQLAEQYLDFIRQAKSLRLEIAADYLVMAAWLAYLKSRLLLPVVSEENEPSGAELAAALKFQLQRLEAMQNAAEQLKGLPQRGKDFFARGEPQPLEVVRTSTYEANLYDLLKAYGRNKVRVDATRLRIVPTDLYTVDDALHRLRRLVDQVPGWQTLISFLPQELMDELHQRSALATTFAASLEMCREGQVAIRQDFNFGPIYLRHKLQEAQKTP